MGHFGRELVQSAEEALAIARGELPPARVFDAQTIEVAAIRRKLGLSQEKFAVRFGLNLGVLRDWEQKRRNPDQAARTLLAVIEREPEAVARTVEPTS
jgi:putative transcriptional regulator